MWTDEELDNLPVISWWKLIWVKIVGRRFSSTDDGVTVIGYHYKGDTYITDIKD